jgi:uncharacterized membrane protein
MGVAMSKRFCHLHIVSHLSYFGKWLIPKLGGVYNPLNKLVRRIRIKMKELRTALIMTLIPLAFVLVLEGSHSSQLVSQIAYDVAGIALFAFSMWLWYRTAKQIKATELEEERNKDDLTTAINNLVREIRKDRAERNK